LEDSDRSVIEEESETLSMIDMETAREIHFRREVYKSRPWYHDFSKLGIQTNFSTGLPRFLRVQKKILSLLGRDIIGLNLRGENYVKNQRDKEEWLLPFLGKAFKLNSSKAESFLDVFCADGYYSFWVKQNFNPGRIVGVDITGEDIRRCLLIKSILNFDRIEFRQQNVLEMSKTEKFDIVLNAGGLYHLQEPSKFIELSYAITRRLMVLQTVVTLETESEDYFVSPAPGWKHGCRFTDAWIRKRLSDIGWRIIQKERNVLSGNERLCDRGSSYFLLEKNE